MKLLIMDTGVSDGTVNCAIDQQLLDMLTDTPILRLYQWRPTLSLGRFQKPDTVNQLYCQQHHIEIVRRITGGRAILHGTDLTYSFYCPLALIPGSILDTYRTISQALILALSSISIQADMSPVYHRSNAGNSNCFATDTAYEITVYNKKLIGSAQRRYKTHLLQHGSLMLSIDWPHYLQCFSHHSITESDISAAQSVMTALTEISSTPIAISDLKTAIIEGFATQFQRSPVPIS